MFGTDISFLYFEVVEYENFEECRRFIEIIVLKYILKSILKYTAKTYDKIKMQKINYYEILMMLNTFHTIAYIFQC